jgi:hypothetical protein
MKHQDRKAAIAAYKERKVTAGIYAVRCSASGETWVGWAPDLTTIENRLWFTLRHGANTHRSLQAAWNSHGRDGLTVEVLERLEEEEIVSVREATVKARHAFWRDKLGATAI